MVLQSREASLGEMCHHGHRQPQWGFEGKKRELSFYIWKTKWVLALTDFQGDGALCHMISLTCCGTEK